MCLKMHSELKIILHVIASFSYKTLTLNELTKQAFNRDAVNVRGASYKRNNSCIHKMCYTCYYFPLLVATVDLRQIFQ